MLYGLFLKARPPTHVLKARSVLMVIANHQQPLPAFKATS